MGPFFTTNPFGGGDWYECSGNTRRLVPLGQRNWLAFTGVQPLPIDAGWFLSYPVATG